MRCRPSLTCLVRLDLTDMPSFVNFKINLTHLCKPRSSTTVPDLGKRACKRTYFEPSLLLFMNPDAFTVNQSDSMLEKEVIADYYLAAKVGN